MSRIPRDPDKLRAWKRRSKRLKRGKAELRNSARSKPRRRYQPTTGFRLWVRATLRCAVRSCRKPGPDPHHVKATGMGGRKNPWAHDENNGCPLCRTHHGLGESPGWSWVRFQEHFGLDLEQLAIETWDRWMALPAEERARWEGRAYRINLRNGVPESRARRPRG